MRHALFCPVNPQPMTGTIENNSSQVETMVQETHPMMISTASVPERQGLMSQTTILLWTAIAEAIWLTPVGLYYQCNRDTMTVHRKRVLLTTATIVSLAVMTIAAVISLTQ